MDTPIDNSSTSSQHTTPLVTIVMLTWNRADLIEEAIKSICAQDYKNWELFIIDDGSTDNTPAIVANFLNNKIQYIKHDQNRGLIKQRVESLSYGAGKYIAILDSDDIWISTDKLSHQVQFLEQNSSCVAVGTDVHIIDTNKTIIGTFKRYYDNHTLRNHALRSNPLAHSSTLIRRAALQGETYSNEFPIWEDFELFLRLGTRGALANLHNIWTGYRVHGGNISKSARLRGARVHLAIIQKYKKNYPNYLISWIKAQIRILFGYIGK